jgi:glycosyltransferase involved in cell wall biosynthesis
VIPVFYNARCYADSTTDNEDFLKRRLAGEISLVFIGRFVPNKRPDNLIRVTAALKKMTGRPAGLRLHGKVWDIPYFRWLRSLSEGAGVEHEISFEINQPQVALRTSLASADAFVSMSDHEGFMVPLVEAFSVCLGEAGPVLKGAL